MTSTCSVTKRESSDLVSDQPPDSLHILNSSTCLIYFVGWGHQSTLLFQVLYSKMSQCLHTKDRSCSEAGNLFLSWLVSQNLYGTFIWVYLVLFWFPSMIVMKMLFQDSVCLLYEPLHLVAALYHFWQFMGSIKASMHFVKPSSLS